MLWCGSGREVELSASYKALFPSLLLPMLWDNKGAIPGLVSLVCVRARCDVFVRGSLT